MSHIISVATHLPQVLEERNNTLLARGPRVVMVTTVPMEKMIAKALLSPVIFLNASIFYSLVPFWCFDAKGGEACTVSRNNIA
jgi:hypothetical protein